MITRKTTIDQHIGTHPLTGLPMFERRDIVTEYDLDASNRADRRWVDEVHAARCQLEMLNAEQRKRAYDWLAAHDHDTSDEASAYRAAIVAATGPVVTLTDLHVTDGATGVRTSEMDGRVRVDRITVSGKGSVGIDLDD